MSAYAGRIVAWSLAVGACLPCGPTAALAQERAAEATTDREPSGWEAFPATLLDPTYIADPLQPRIAVSVVAATGARIADTGDARFGLWLGGRFPLLGLTPQGRPERAWQLAIEAGFYGQFDMDNNQDNVGWDGIYGLVLAKKLGPRTALKLAAKHVSSHVGDELQERTMRRRINYTREELIFGISRQLRAGWRLYAEAAWGYRLRNTELQEPGRAQAGLEFRTEQPVFWRAHWYTASNLTAFEEGDWEPDVMIQNGLEVPSGDRLWRLGLAFYDGRVPIGEFFQDRERYLVFGLWLDP